MKNKILFLTGILVCLLGVGCSVKTTTTATSNTEIQSPEAVLINFYSDYLSYFTDPKTGDFRDPLADRIYDNRTYLTQNLIDTIDSTIASFTVGAYDPILCGQSTPDFIIPGDAYVMTGRVMYYVKDSFETHSFFVYLEKESDGWKIDKIDCNL